MCGHFAQSLQTVFAALAPVPAATTLPEPFTFTTGVAPCLSSPSNQSAEQACTRQIRSSTSTPGIVTPFSYRAYCCWRIPSSAAICDCGDGPRSSRSLSEKILTILQLFSSTPLTQQLKSSILPLVTRQSERKYITRRGFRSNGRNRKGQDNGGQGIRSEAEVFGWPSHRASADRFSHWLQHRSQRTVSDHTADS